MPSNSKSAKRPQLGANTQFGDHWSTTQDVAATIRRTTAARSVWTASDVDQFALAAQLFTHLGASSSELKPDHESQLRPLGGLPQEHAKLAWACGAPETQRAVAYGRISAAQAFTRFGDKLSPTVKSFIGRDRHPEGQSSRTAAIGEVSGATAADLTNEVL